MELHSDYRMEYRIIRPDGALVWVVAEGRGVYADDSSVLGMIGIVRDVTELKRAEELRNQLAAIVESSDDAIVSKSLDSIITTWNAGAERIFGYQADEVVGKSIRILIPPERSGEEDVILSRLRQGERIEHFETVRVRKDGKRINISLSVSPVQDALGNITGAAKIARDITDRVQTEKALQEETKALELINQSGTTLASSLELNTVLQKVTDYATQLSGAQFGAFFYNVTEQNGDAYQLYTLSGAPREAFEKVGSKSVAEKFRQQTVAKLSLGLVTTQERKRWEEFRKQFAADGLTGLAEGTVREYMNALDSFERIIKPVYMDAVTSAAIDAFVSVRSKEPGRLRIPKAQAAGAERKQKRRKEPKATPLTSPATINKELRHLKAAFKKAKKWKLLAEAPEVEMLEAFQDDPYFVDDDTFKLLYDACDQMARPADRHYGAGEWWKALLCFAYLTGWRIGEILDLKRADLDLETGIATVAAGSTKGRRTARIQLHPAIIYQLKQIADFSELVFDWPHHHRTLWDEFRALKKAAGVTFPGAFHRFRFGFANANVDNLDADLLQKLMRHQDAKTTQIYINAAHRLSQAKVAEKLHAPGFLPRDAG